MLHESRRTAPHNICVTAYGSWPSPVDDADGGRGAVSLCKLDLSRHRERTGRGANARPGRHCERSEAIYRAATEAWIASSHPPSLVELRRDKALLAMTRLAVFFNSFASANSVHLSRFWWSIAASAAVQKRIAKLGRARLWRLRKSAADGESLSSRPAHLRRHPHPNPPPRRAGEGAHRRRRDIENPQPPNSPARPHDRPHLIAFTRAARPRAPPRRRPRSGRP